MDNNDIESADALLARSTSNCSNSEEDHGIDLTWSLVGSASYVEGQGGVDCTEVILNGQQDLLDAIASVGNDSFDIWESKAQQRRTPLSLSAIVISNIIDEMPADVNVDNEESASPAVETSSLPLPENTEDVAIRKTKATIPNRPYVFNDVSILSSLLSSSVVPYDGFREIRRDGNEYFRTVIFGLLEQMVISDQKDLFVKLKDKFSYCEGYLTDSDVFAFHDLLFTMSRAAGSW